MEQEKKCGGSCGCCSLSHVEINGLRGWKLVGLAVFVFLLPCVAALVVAPFFVDHKSEQAFAMMGVLIVAFVASPMLFRIMTKRRGEIDE